MSLRSEVAQVFNDRSQVAFRSLTAVQMTIALSPITIFTITGGPIWVKAIFARLVAAEGAGSTWAATLCAIAMQNAAVAIAGAINTIVTWPLGAAAGQVIVPALLTQPPYSLANALLGQVGQGQIASVGTFALTVGVANMTAPAEFFMVYSKMHPASNVG